ncbi:MAG TPA: hypothetical protein VH331_16120 [Allosphingosinicella sp.]|jgi:hypothetical protein|nr:hypothetical protein [Allosphingosinicella sp.]
MDGTGTPDWFFWISWGCPTLGALLSILYRRRAGKPIFPKVPADVRYVDRRGSAPFASNCLLVWVTADTLEIVPYFPFTLMFLPEVYGLERSIPISTIRDVKRPRFSLSNVIVTYGDEDRRLRLTVRRPNDLVAALQR